MSVYYRGKDFQTGISVKTECLKILKLVSDQTHSEGVSMSVCMLAGGAFTVTPLPVRCW